MSGLSTRVTLAVLVGFTVDYIGTSLAGAIFGASVMAAAGTSSVQDLILILEGSPPLQLAILALGLTLTLVGAFVAAWIARGEERAAAFGVGVLSTVVGFVDIFAAPEAAPFWLEASGLLLTVPAAFAGGEVRRAIAARGRTP